MTGGNATQQADELFALAIERCLTSVPSTSTSHFTCSLEHPPARMHTLRRAALGPPAPVVSTGPAVKVSRRLVRRAPPKPARKRVPSGCGRLAPILRIVDHTHRTLGSTGSHSLAAWPLPFQAAPQMNPSAGPVVSPSPSLARTEDCACPSQSDSPTLRYATQRSHPCHAVCCPFCCKPVHDYLTLRINQLLGLIAGMGTASAVTGRPWSNRSSTHHLRLASDGRSNITPSTAQDQPVVARWTQGFASNGVCPIDVIPGSGSLTTETEFWCTIELAADWSIRRIASAGPLQP